MRAGDRGKGKEAGLKREGDKTGREKWATG